MARRKDFSASTKTIAVGVAQTIVWTNSDIPSERVVAYAIGLTGGNTLADVTRIRCMANGADIVNITPAQLRAHWQAFSWGTYTPALTDTGFVLPLAMIDQPTPDQADVCQFPIRSQVEINVVLAATAVAGAAYAAWVETTMAPGLFPRMLGQSMNIPASTPLQRFNFQENGVIRGLTLPHVGVQRLKFVVSREEIENISGPDFLGVATYDLALATETLTWNATNKTLTSPVCHRVTIGLPAALDGSYIELQTGAGWAGAGNELATYAVVGNSLQ